MQADRQTKELQCWKCGASLAALSLPLRRLEECKSCGAELHVCRLCVDYDPAVANACREPIAEEVSDKIRANFCDYFKPRPEAYTPPDAAALTRARAGLDALFGTAAAGDPAPDPQREALDALFRKPG